MTLETSSVNVRAMYEAVKYSAALDKQNEEYVESEAISEKTSMLLKIWMEKQGLIMK